MSMVIYRFVSGAFNVRSKRRTKSLKIAKPILIWLAMALLVCVGLGAGQLNASGFGVFSHGASSFGQAGASIAHSDSPSSIFYNPALISDLQGTQVEIGTTLVRLSFSHDSQLTGQESATDNALHFPSTFHAVHQYSSSLSMGVGIFSPFGLSSEWGDTWEGRYIATDSEMESVCVNPVISYKVTPKFAMAVGINLLYLDTSFKNAINFSAYGFEDGVREFTGDGTEFGFNLGLLYQATKRISFGASYRSGYDVDVAGEVAFDLPESGVDLLSGILPDMGGKTTLNLPDVAFAAAAYQFGEKLVLETGILWEGWSDFNEIAINFSGEINGMTSEIVERRWNDTLTYNIGGDYFYNDHLTFRAGYLYRENAIPDETLEPSLPDADAHLFALGGDIKWQAYTLSLAYVYEVQKDRDKTNLIGTELGGNANGTYSSDIHFIAVSLNRKF